MCRKAFGKVIGEAGKQGMNEEIFVVWARVGALEIVMGCSASVSIFANRLDVIYKVKRKVEYRAKDFGWNIYKNGIPSDWDGVDLGWQEESGASY